MGGEGDGKLLAGRYRLADVLGRGGMGTVWRAKDEVLGRTVAVKELRFPSAIDDDEKRRLITRTLREAKAIARIRSTGAVTVYDVVEEDDRPWIVMELIEGRSLADVTQQDGPLTPHRAAEVGLAVLDVLRAAHAQGILHRDVKPSNVLISDDGRVVLTDFGIAQVEGDPSITSTGMLVGAPSYISPERARGQRPGPAADLWSLGGLLYAAVEGRPPYDLGSAIATLTAVMTKPFDPPKNAGPLEEVIYGLLTKDPERRLDDAGARALLTHAVDAPEDTGPEPPPDATKVVPLPPAQSPPPAARERTPAEPAAAPARKLAAPPRHRPKPAGPPPWERLTARVAALPRHTLLVVAAVVVALAVLGTVLAVALSGGDDGGTGDKGGRKPAPTGAAGKKAQGKEGEEKESAARRSPSASTSEPGPSPRHRDDGLPAGYAKVRSPQFHFSVGLPEGWHRTGTSGRNSGAIYSAKGGFPRVQVDFTGSPGKDALASWRSLEPAVKGSSSGYHRLAMKRVRWRSYPTVADWEFTRSQDGRRTHVLNRGFVVDGSHGYALMITCPAAEWNGAKCRTLRSTVFRSFEPAR